jgi:hypothetical protein
MTISSQGVSSSYRREVDVIGNVAYSARDYAELGKGCLVLQTYKVQMQHGAQEHVIC